MKWSSTGKISILSHNLNFRSLIKGSIRVHCQPGPMKKTFLTSTQVTFLWPSGGGGKQKKNKKTSVFMRDVAYCQCGPP